MKTYHSPLDAYGHPSAPITDAYSAPSDAYGPPLDTYGAPESPVSNSQPQYSGHYTYDENLTPSTQITYFDTKK